MEQTFRFWHGILKNQTKKKASNDDGPQLFRHKRALDELNVATSVSVKLKTKIY